MPKLPPRCPFCRKYWRIYYNKDNTCYAEHICGETHQLQKYVNTAAANYDLLEEELYQFEEDGLRNLSRTSTLSDHGSYPPRKTCGLLEEDA